MTPRLTANRFTAKSLRLKFLLTLLALVLASTACNEAPTLTLAEPGQAASSADAPTAPAGEAESPASPTSPTSPASGSTETAATTQSAVANRPWGHCDSDRFFLDGLTAGQALDVVGADAAAITEIEDSSFTGCTIWGAFASTDEYVQVYDPGQLHGSDFDIQAGVFYDGSNLIDIDGYRAVTTGKLITVDIGDHAMVVHTSLSDEATLALTRHLVALHPGAGAPTIDRGAPPIVDLDEELGDAFGSDSEAASDGSDDSIPVNPATGLPEWIEGNFPSWATCDDRSVLGVDTSVVAANLGVPAIVGNATNGYTNETHTDNTLGCTLLIPNDDYGAGEDIFPGIEITADIQEVGRNLTQAEVEAGIEAEPSAERVETVGGPTYLLVQGSEVNAVVPVGDRWIFFRASSWTDEHSGDEVRQTLVTVIEALKAAGM